MVDSILLLQAFAAGVISFFAPCTIAMLPAYVGYFLGRDDETAEPGPDDPAPPPDPTDRPRLGATLAIPGAAALLYGLFDVFAVNAGRASLSPLQIALIVGGTVLLAAGLRFLVGRAVLRGARFGAITSVGIIGVFLLIGLPVTLLIGSLLDVETLYRVVLVVGAAIVGLGVLYLAGRDLSVTIPWKAPRTRSDASFLTFGVGYGIVGTGCNLPVFLLPIAGAIAQGGAVDGLFAFLAYGLGTASLMVAVSVAVAAGKDVGNLAKLTGPWIKRAMGALLVAAGAYIIYYAWVLITTGVPP